MLMQQQSHEAYQGPLEPRAAMALGLPQTLPLSLENVSPFRSQPGPHPLKRAVPGQRTHPSLFWVPVSYLHHSQRRLHLHLGSSHELDDRGAVLWEK